MTDKMISNIKNDTKHNISKRFFTIFLLLVLLSFSCFCDDLSNSEAQNSIKVALPAKYNLQNRLLPQDAKIGNIVQANSSIYHAFLYTALSCEYSYEWTQKYISETSQKVISEIYGTYLSENLPFKNFLMSSMFENANQSISINVRNGEDVFCFVIGNDKTNDKTNDEANYEENNENANDSGPKVLSYDNLRIIAIRQL